MSVPQNPHGSPGDSPPSDLPTPADTRPKAPTAILPMSTLERILEFGPEGTPAGTPPRPPAAPMWTTPVVANRAVPPGRDEAGPETTIIAGPIIRSPGTAEAPTSEPPADTASASEALASPVTPPSGTTTAVGDGAHTEEVSGSSAVDEPSSAEVESTTSRDATASSAALIPVPGPSAGRQDDTPTPDSVSHLEAPPDSTNRPETPRDRGALDETVVMPAVDRVTGPVGSSPRPTPTAVTPAVTSPYAMPGPAASMPPPSPEPMSRMPLNMMAAGVYGPGAQGAGHATPGPGPGPGQYAQPAAPPWGAPHPVEPVRGSSWKRFSVIGAALVGIVLLACVITYLSSGPSTPAAKPVPQKTPPTSDYSMIVEKQDPGCAERSYGRVRDFFATTDCQALIRTLYTGKADDGGQVVISVLAVTMRTAEEATRLRELVDTSNTGNVNDLLKEGAKVPGGPDRLTSAGYASKQDGRVVVIVETDFADTDRKDKAELTRIATEALKMDS